MEVYMMALRREAQIRREKADWWMGVGLSPDDAKRVKGDEQIDKSAGR